MKAGSIAVLLGLAAVAGCSRSTPREAAPATAAEYVDARLCAGCHAGIAKSYRQTGMGRSFYRATPANLNVEDFHRNNRFNHNLSDRQYEMIRRDDRSFMRRHQVGTGGQP